MICDTFHSMFYCVQVLYTTNQQTAVSGIFKDPSWIHKLYALCFNLEHFFKCCKTLPLNGYYMQQVAVRWQSRNLTWKCSMAQPQRYPLNLYRINSVEDIAVFLAWKVFTIKKILHCSSVTEMRKSSSWKLSYSFLIIQSFKGYRCKSDKPFFIF